MRASPTTNLPCPVHTNSQRRPRNLPTVTYRQNSLPRRCRVQRVQSLFEQNNSRRLSFSLHGSHGLPDRTESAATCWICDRGACRISGESRAQLSLVHSPQQERQRSARVALAGRCESPVYPRSFGFSPRTQWGRTGLRATRTGEEICPECRVSHECIAVCCVKFTK